MKVGAADALIQDIDRAADQASRAGRSSLTRNLGGSVLSVIHE
jgi:hypothetical protein